MEKDDELKGEGNSYDFGARMFDSRIGRWFAPDPEYKAFESTYVGIGNNPIYLVDFDGKDWVVNNQGFYLWIEEEDDMENIPSGFKALGSVGDKLPSGVDKYHILTVIDDKLYHEHTTNIFAKMGNALGGNYIEKKEYDRHEEDYMGELQSMAVGYGIGKVLGIAFKGLSPAARVVLGRVESLMVKGKVANAIGEAWKLNSFSRGKVLESILSGTRYSTYKWLEQVSKNYPAIDFFKKGLGVQLKTFDAKKVNFSFYRKAIDKLVRNIGKKVDGEIMTKGKLEIGVKSAEQLKLFDKVKKYGKGKGVDVEVFQTK